jgi:hypothetical protein
MDPAMMGGAPPAGAMPMPAPAPGAPPISGQPIVVGLDDLIQLFMEVSGGGGGAAPAPAEGGGEAPATNNEPKPAEGAKVKETDKLDQVLQNQEQLISILTGALGSTPDAAPPGAVGAMPEAMGQGVAGAPMPPPELPAAPEGMPPGAAPPPGMAAPPPGMTVAASDRKNALTPKQADERVSSINKVMNNLMDNGNKGRKRR